MSIFLIVLGLLTFPKQQSSEVTFKAADGVEITADLHVSHPKSAPFIVLFHQARSSRGEYLDIAPRLSLMGFNCMAVDLRSGQENNGVRNETKIAAEKAMKPTQYINAYQDMDAAIKYARKYFADSTLLIWGSSYSSALALRYAGDYPEAIDAVMAFSPGEYFRNQGKSADYIKEGAKNIRKPVFITSAKNEKTSWWSIFEAIPGEHKTYFLPTTAGNHGSKALWRQFGDSLKYWEAVEKFLKDFK
jgi:dienelactone hydrolase